MDDITNSTAVQKGVVEQSWLDYSKKHRRAVFQGRMSAASLETERALYYWVMRDTIHIVAQYGNKLLPLKNGTALLARQLQVMQEEVFEQVELYTKPAAGKAVAAASTGNLFRRLRQWGRK